MLILWIYTDVELVRLMIVASPAVRAVLIPLSKPVFVQATQPVVTTNGIDFASKKLRRTNVVLVAVIPVAMREAPVAMTPVL